MVGEAAALTLQVVAFAARSLQVGAQVFGGRKLGGDLSASVRKIFVQAVVVLLTDRKGDSFLLTAVMTIEYTYRVASSS